jgi:hypothetical protein
MEHDHRIDSTGCSDQDSLPRPKKLPRADCRGHLFLQGDHTRIVV